MAGESPFGARWSEPAVLAERQADGAKDLNLLWKRLTERDKEIAQLRMEMDHVVRERDAVEAGLRGELSTAQQRLQEYVLRAEKAEAKGHQLQKELAEALGLTPPASPRSAPRPTLPMAAAAPTIAALTSAIGAVSTSGMGPGSEAVASLDAEGLCQSHGEHPGVPDSLHGDEQSLQQLRVAYDSKIASLEGAASATQREVEAMCSELTAFEQSLYSQLEDAMRSAQNHMEIHGGPTVPNMDEQCIQELRSAYEAQIAALEDASSTSKLEVEVLSSELEACKRNASVDVERLEAEHAQFAFEVQKKHARRISEMQGQVSVGFQALEVARRELQSAQIESGSATEAELREQLAATQEALAATRQQVSEIAFEIGSGATSSHQDTASLLAGCQSGESGALGSTMAPAARVAVALRQRKLMRKRAVAHRKRARFATAQLSAMRRRTEIAQEMLQSEQDEWLQWRQELIQWWQQASLAGATLGDAGAQAPQLPDDWSQRVKREWEEKEIRKYLRRQGRKAKAGRASRVVKAVVSAVTGHIGTGAVSRTASTMRKASQGSAAAMQIGSAPATMMQAGSAPSGVASGEHDLGRDPMTGGEDFDDNSLGTSFLMNCSKESRAHAKGADQESAVSWLKLPKMWFGST